MNKLKTIDYIGSKSFFNRHNNLIKQMIKTDIELIKKFLENKKESLFIGQEKAVNTSEEVNKRDIENYKQQINLFNELKEKNYNCNKLAIDFTAGRIWIQDINETTIKKYKTAQKSF